MARARRGRTGFTLIELSVALVLIGIAAALAHAVVSVGVQGRDIVVASRRSLDRERNGQRLLAELFGSADVGGVGSIGFDGAEDRVEFDARDLSAHGWFERRRVTIHVEGGHLLLERGGAEPAVLADDVHRLELDYLLEYGADAPWVATWRSPVSAPLAVRTRVTRMRPGGSLTVDTALFLVGPRG